MNVEPLAIEGVYRATPRRKAAGKFDWFRLDALAAALPADWRPAIGTVQTVHRGHLSGLHVEPGHRLVTCVTGRISLVVVDLRRGGPTFRRWIPIDLEPIDRPTIVVPPGTAWGFQGFSDVASLLTVHEQDSNGPPIDPADEELQIAWPLPVEPAGVPLGQGLAEHGLDG